MCGVPGAIQRRWNEACDYAINPLLLDAGLSLPDGVLVDHRFRGMSAEQIYNLRDAEAQPQSGGQNSSNATVPELARAKRQKSKTARMSQLRQRRRAASARFLMHLCRRRDAECGRAGARVECCRQPGRHALEAGRQDSCGSGPHSRRSRRGNGGLARTVAPALVRHHPRRFELDAAQPPPHLERTLSAWSCARGCRRDCHRCRLLRLGEWPVAASL
jgi:hypothetical protein